MYVSIIPVAFTFFIASEQDSSKLQDKDAGGPIGVSPLPAISKKSGAQLKSTTSGSSVEQSDDDEAEGENEENQGPTDAKRMRRYSAEYFSFKWLYSIDSFLVMLGSELMTLLYL